MVCVMCDEYSSKDSDPIVSWRVCVVWMRNLLSLWYHHRAHWGGMASIPTGNNQEMHTGGDTVEEGCDQSGRGGRGGEDGVGVVE